MTALIGEPVGIEETEDGTWQLRPPPAKAMRRRNEGVTHHAG
ncbi:MAG TPA: hypothetical protein VH858_10085 [Hyphomicrobiales bacterium]